MFRIALLASVIVLAVGRASAQTLPALTITALSITSDRTAAPEGEAFHLRIHVHTKQSGADLASLVLPDVVNLTILGDEKRTASAGNGTDYIETLTVAGVSPGDASVSPAYIDARDPSRGDKPFRFSSNRLRLRITGARNPGFTPLASAAMHAARVVVAIVIVVIVLVAIGFLIVRTRALAGRRKTYTTLPRARPVSAPVTVTPVDQRAQIRNAALGLASTRTRSAATLLRTALFALAGARRDETVSALLERVPKEHCALRAALRAAERAVFVDESHLQGAIDDLLDAVRAVVSG
ncbi:MAG: hypothetical protein ACREML_03585 [Vulcanimicrobiaceae bacterium]